MGEVELAGQEADYGVWVRALSSALGMGRMVAPHAVIQERIRAGWEALATPRTQMEMRGGGGSKRGNAQSHRVAAPAVATPSPATRAIPGPGVQGGFEFAQLAVPERFVAGLRAWCTTQYYEVRVGDSLTPGFRMLTVWRRWQHIVIEVEEDGEEEA